MNILMATNTWLPHVGGVARSVDLFTRGLRSRGHGVMVVCPEFEGLVQEDEEGVVRVPALQRFNGSDFSVPLPVPAGIRARVRTFAPDVVHSHHPFLLGDTALRIAAELSRPIIFTHHTMYERYTHYVPADSPRLRRFVMELSTGYGNLCSAVIAPSESIRKILQARGVETPIEVIPTGVDAASFVRAGGDAFRAAAGIPRDAFVIGHVGRLAPEKNLVLLARAVAGFLRYRPDAWFLVIGEGPSLDDIRREAEQAGVGRRVCFAGVRRGADLVRGYRAMDLFAFASTSETQGLVIMEAMAAGLFCVAIDAPGVRDVLRHGENGWLVAAEDARELQRALERAARLSVAARLRRRDRIEEMAQRYAVDRSLDQVLDLYERLRPARPVRAPPEESGWWRSLRRIEAEWAIWSNVAASVSEAVRSPVRRGPRRWQQLHRRLHRWRLRLGRAIGIPVQPDSREHGLIIVQIDGLSRRQFERALVTRRLPFLRTLITRHHYRLRTFYSGLPSSTPAVQGELFYGVRGVVPSFEFLDREERRLVRMTHPGAAWKRERQLAATGAGLLEAGSSYSNIYSGGAEECAFSAAHIDLRARGRIARPLSALLLAWGALAASGRTLLLVGLEAVLACVDSVRGISCGRDLWLELSFIPTRVSICIFLRELITHAACVDTERGVPIIHLNYVGYDEQAHRRGPTSAFAHWSLKGIDDSIRRIWETARRSPWRSYQLWVYSDHGQEETVPYREVSGVSIEETVARIFGTATFSVPSAGGERIEPVRSPIWRRRWFGQLTGGRGGIPDHAIVVSALGPVGHIYLPRPWEGRGLSGCCQELAGKGAVPIVLMVEGRGRVRAWSGGREWVLPRDALELLGPGREFDHELGADLVALCSHPDAGDVVLLGWRRHGIPISFPPELGSHAGPGVEETRAFVLLPPGEGGAAPRRSYLRPGDLRALILRARGRPAASEPEPAMQVPGTPPVSTGVARRMPSR